MRDPHRRVALHAVALGVLLALGAVLAAGCRGSKTPAPPLATVGTAIVAATSAPASGSATSIPPSPTAPPADPKLGERLRYEGDFEAAAQVYGEIAAQKKGQQQQDARLAQAQLLIRSRRPGDTKPVLEAYIATAGPAADGSDARYLLASTLDDLNDEAGALAGYDAYIAAGGVLSNFARVERAKLLARLGRAAEAEQAATAVIASSDLLPSFLASFTLSMGKAYEQGHNDLAALAWYDRAKTESGDVASASARAGAVRKRLADPAWVAEYLLVVRSYPGSGPAAALLDELDAAGVPVSDYARGVVDYLAHRNDAARAAFVRAVTAGDSAAEASYYLGALDERGDDKPAAILDYGRAYELDRQSSLADDALWWRGRLLEGAGRLDEAATVYQTLVTGYPQSKWRSDAALRRGLVLYKAANYTAAAVTWSQLVPASEGDDALRARFWQGRALVAAKDPLGTPVLEQLAADADARGNFYALRAEVLLGRNIADGGARTPRTDDTPDWSNIAAYVTGITGSDAATTAPQQAVIDADPRWAMAAALDAVGLRAQSTAVFRSLIPPRAPMNVDRLLHVTQRLQEAGRVSLAARAATTLIASLPLQATPPDDLVRVAYPMAYGDLVIDAAKRENISPLLLLALVRQESLYDADVGSGAGALGLTQVVPGTGTAIADELGVNGFVANDLFKPKLNLRFGASYLASQLKSFDGNAYEALAAYNGGPGTASNAIAAGGPDVDVDRFVEELEFDETRSYVKLVMENYARYRQLYQGIDHASLPK